MFSASFATKFTNYCAQKMNLSGSMLTIIGFGGCDIQRVGMFRKMILPTIAVLGIIFSIFMIYYGARKPPVAPILFPPPTSPYKHFLVGEGIIESAYKDIAIGVPFPELISDVYVKVGDIVKKGTPLFKLDTRQFESQLAQAKAELAVAEKDYESLKVQFSFYQRLAEKTAASEQAYQAAFYNVELAQKRLEASSAAVKVIEMNIERSTIRASVDGEILQVNIRVGETANVNPFNQQSLILMGDTNFYHMRINIDEEDAWRVEKGAPARAFVRGNSKNSFPLEYVYYEPYIIPKASLSGVNTERVDTRVLQVVYKFERNSYPVYTGQLLDVYIEAKPSEAQR